jgi:hypothetical protein
VVTGRLKDPYDTYTRNAVNKKAAYDADEAAERLKIAKAPTAAARNAAENTIPATGAETKM